MVLMFCLVPKLIQYSLKYSKIAASMTYRAVDLKGIFYSHKELDWMQNRI